MLMVIIVEKHPGGGYCWEGCTIGVQYGAARGCQESALPPRVAEGLDR